MRKFLRNRLALVIFIVSSVLLAGVFLSPLSLAKENAAVTAVWEMTCPYVAELVVRAGQNEFIVSCETEEIATETPTLTFTPTDTETIIPSLTSTNTRTPTLTSVPSSTSTRTFTLIPFTSTATKTSTSIPTNTSTYTSVPTGTFTYTPTSTKTETPTLVPSLTSTPTRTATKTNTPTVDPYPSPVTFTPPPTNTAYPSPVTATPTLLATIISTFTPTVTQGNFIYVDHTNVDEFHLMTLEDEQRARNLKMVFMDRSVGVNLNDGLNCLQYNGYLNATSACKRDLPERERWFRSYPRPNWVYDIEAGTWTEMMNEFINVKFPQYKAQGYDVISFQFSYLNVDSAGSYNIQNDFFNPNYSGYNIYDLVALEEANPDIKFIYWTTSLSKVIGTNISTEFNEKLRQFARDNNKILFDFADIESHDLTGNLCTYAGAYPRICNDYTTELVGGHLGSMATGSIRLSKAFWYLMSQIK